MEDTKFEFDSIEYVEGTEEIVVRMIYDNVETYVYVNENDTAVCDFYLANYDEPFRFTFGAMVPDDIIEVLIRGTVLDLNDLVEKRRVNIEKRGTVEKIMRKINDD